MKTEYQIENSVLTRRFHLTNQHVTPGPIFNRLSNRTLVPEEGSELFNLSLDVSHPQAVQASDLTVTALESTHTPDGQTLRITFAPFSGPAGTWTVIYETSIDNKEIVAHSRLFLTCTDPDAKLDYLELEALVLPNNIRLFTRPSDYSVPETTWNYPDHDFLLGQPVYTDSLFWGCEFPATDNHIDGHKLQLRYQPGQSFAERRDSDRLTAQGAWQSPDFILGVAKDDDPTTLQAALFDYLQPEMVPTPLRCQYNGWYDDRMGVTSDRSLRLFEQAHDALAAAGVPPLDAYVVDDGWNNYNDPDFTGIDAEDSGRTYNRTGFWEFNDKFPDELYPTSALAKRYGSTFGLWLGPQGGYDLNDTFAQYLEKMGTGYLNKQAASGAALDTASRNYTSRLKRLFIDYQNRFDIRYWKIDGFASRPSTDPTHEHPVGGPDGAYATTALWEDWRDIFIAMRQVTPDLFINTTCFINPSPWWLRYVNTIWLQNSGDLEQSGTGNDAQRMITGRDSIYYRNVKDAQVQFPLSHYYNHEPIYGYAAHIKMTTEDFRQYLFATAMRGSHLWELYFSPSLMDEDKWQVVSDVLAFVREYEVALDHVVLYGGDPRANEAYGYQGWTATQGVVSASNPSDEPQTMTVPVLAKSGRYSLTQWEPLLAPTPSTENPSFNAGETMTLTLAPHETRIMTFNRQRVPSPKLTSAKIYGKNELKLSFDRRVTDMNAFYIAGQPVDSYQFTADRRTVIVHGKEPFLNKQPISVEIHELAGLEGGTLTQSLSLQSYPDGLIAQWPGLNSGVTDNMPGIPAWQDTFSLTIDVPARFKPGDLVSQPGLFQLSINPDGLMSFNSADHAFTASWQETRVVEPEQGLNGTPQHHATVTATSLHGKLTPREPHTVSIQRGANYSVMLRVDGELIGSGMLTADGGGRTLSINPDNVISATLKQR